MGRLDDGDYVFTHLPGVRVVFTASPSWERNIPNWVVWSVDDEKATMSGATVDTWQSTPAAHRLAPDCRAKIESFPHTTAHTV